MSNDFANRVRSLKQRSVSGQLAKDLKLGNYTLTGWLGGVNDDGTPAPRICMGTLKDIQTKGLPNAQQKYLSQFKNQGLPPEAFNMESGLVIIRVESNEPPRTFPADTPAIEGKVKYFREREGTGHVVGPDGTEYFVHHSEILCDAEVFPNLRQGETVRFIPSDRNGQAIACSVAPAEEA